MENLPLSANVFEWIGFSTVFSYSFLVSLHCVGMCGPLACSLLGRSGPNFWRSNLLYNLGRCFSYCLAGALAGTLAGFVSSFWPPLTQILSVVFGTLLCLWALIALLNLERKMPFPGFRAPLSFFQRRINVFPQSFKAFALGAFTLLLPCMTLHPLLFMSAAHQTASAGALTMFAFFLGTLPAMLSATYVPTLIPQKANISAFRKIGQFMLFLAGLITIGRGLIHH